MVVDSDVDLHEPRQAPTPRSSRAHDAGLAGASVFRGIEGFSVSRRVHSSRILSLAENLPAMILIIDTGDRIDDFLPQLAELGVRGVIAVDDVEIVRPDSGGAASP